MSIFFNRSSDLLCALQCFLLAVLGYVLSVVSSLYLFTVGQWERPSPLLCMSTREVIITKADCDSLDSDGGGGGGDPGWPGVLSEEVVQDHEQTLQDRADDSADGWHGDRLLPAVNYAHALLLFQHCCQVFLRESGRKHR